MADRVYFVPIVGTGQRTDPRRPKYFADGTTPGLAWAMADYGFEPWGVVAADCSVDLHAAVMANADVYAIPANLDSTLTAGDVTAIGTYLENSRTPADWITAGMTWRSVVRRILALWGFFARFAALMGTNTFRGGVTLSTQLQDIPAAARAKLNQAATDQGLNTTGITLQTTLRTALKSISGQKSGPQVLGRMSI